MEMTKNEAEVDGSDSMNFGYDCENLAKIAKISQSYRKFCYAQIFAKLAKFR